MSIESRADDYERRLREAGGTDGVIGGLVKGAERNDSIIKWLAISLAFDVFLSIVLGIVGLVALHNSKAVEDQAWIACRQSNANSASLNAVLDLLIANTPNSPLTPAQQQQRIAGYRALIVTIPKCP